MSVLYDIHIHSCYSTDSKTPLLQQVEAAQIRGLKGICFTDHMDYDFPPEAVKNIQEYSPFIFDELEYKEKIEALRNKISSFYIGKGVECGLQKSKTVCEKNKALAAQDGWDFIIGSLHLVDQRDPYYPEFWEGRDPIQCIRKYLESMLELLPLFHDFDTLGHMDYIVRYAPANFQYDPRLFMEITDEIMRFLIRKDIALEVNTSGLYSRTGCENPHPLLIQRYCELGGEMITIGSDAHTPDRIAGSFEIVEEHLKKAGIHRYTTFNRRTPVFHEF